MTRAQRAQSQTAVTQSRVARATSTRPGSVAFVGSGPGDPGLLTVRAADLIREAEIVITEGPEHPALVRALLGLPEGSEGGPELVDGGFGEDGQPLTHAARAKVVVREVKRGARVVRMLTGDPFVYASGPEEAAACARARLRDRPRRLVGGRGPGVRRHPADHQGPSRGHRRHRRGQGRLEPVRRDQDPGPAVGRELDLRHRQGARRRRS